MPKEEYSALAAFEKIIDIGPWEAIKDKHLRLPEDVVCEEAITKSAETLRALIKQRDIVDFYLYRCAVHTIFPESFYNLEAQVNGKVGAVDGTYRFKSTWYEFKVTSKTKILPVYEKNPTICIIRINAPGSKALTSDIDTSILTTIPVQDKKVLLELLEDRDKRIQGPDYAGQISVAVIDNFYTLSENEFGMTSGVHRDSNAYLDLFSEGIDEVEYPKFKDVEKAPLAQQRNPTLGERKLFLEEEFAEKRSAFKLEKHYLEMAASLFSLALALTTEESAESKREHEIARLAESKKWDEFKRAIYAEIDRVGKSFINDGTTEGAKSAAEFVDKTKKDVDEIFAKTEEFFLRYQEELQKEKKRVMELSHIKASKLKEPDKEKDIEVAALNRLYVRFLNTMTSITGKILEVIEDNKRLQEEFPDFNKKLDEIKKRLAHLQQNAGLFEKEIKEEIEKIEGLESKLSDIRNKFKENLNKIAKLQIEKLQIRYQAHTFANEAYVCRSAVYHVVNGQQDSPAPMTDQTLLCSALQQIGFKLLHSQEIFKRSGRLGEVWNRTSKYGSRVHSLMFPKPVIDEQLSHTMSNHGENRLGILASLKTDNKQLFRAFTLEELLLLNADFNIELRRKKSSLSEGDKEKEASKCFEKLGFNLQKVQQLYYVIATKLTALTYCSRYLRKQALWGAAPPLLLSRALEKGQTASAKVYSPSLEDERKSAKEKVALGLGGARADLQDAQFLGSKTKVNIRDEGGAGAGLEAARMKTTGDADISVISGARSVPSKQA